MNEEEIIAALAEEVGLDAEDGEVTGRSYGSGIVISFGSIEYIVYESYDEAVIGATEEVLYLLDDIGIEGINFNNIGGIEQFVNEKWFEEAYREMAESYIDDLDEEEMEETYGTTDRDEAIEKYIEETESYSDNYIQAYIDDFGKEEFNEVVKKHHLVDYDKLAEVIVETDGPANTLAGYDGKEIEFGDGMYAYRSN